MTVRVLGPYRIVPPDGGERGVRWRVVIVAADGGRRSRCFDTEDTARNYAEALKRVVAATGTDATVES